MRFFHILFNFRERSHSPSYVGKDYVITDDMCWEILHGYEVICENFDAVGKSAGFMCWNDFATPFLAIDEHLFQWKALPRHQFAPKEADFTLCITDRGVSKPECGRIFKHGTETMTRGTLERCRAAVIKYTDLLQYYTDNWIQMKVSSSGEICKQITQFSNEAMDLIHPEIPKAMLPPRGWPFHIPLELTLFFLASIRGHLSHGGGFPQQLVLIHCIHHFHEGDNAS